MTTIWTIEDLKNVKDPSVLNWRQRKIWEELQNDIDIEDFPKEHVTPNQPRRNVSKDTLLKFVEFVFNNEQLISQARSPTKEAVKLFREKTGITLNEKTASTNMKKWKKLYDANGNAYYAKDPKPCVS